MALETYSLQPYDANQLLSVARALAGPVLTGNVTLDTRFLDANNVPQRARWLWLGGSGNITYVKYDGSTQLLKNAVAGIWHPIHAIQINSSGTTATDMVWGS